MSKLKFERRGSRIATKAFGVFLHRCTDFSFFADFLTLIEQNLKK